MKKGILFFALVSALVLLYFYQGNGTVQFPFPGERVQVKMDMEEGNQKLKRQEWFELMHQSDPKDDWQQIEYQNSIAKVNKYGHKSSFIEKSSDELVSIAEGKLIGRWQEKGSSNQAGSVLVTEYDVNEDMIYLVSAGGTLFKGPRIGNEWQLVNQDYRFTNDYLKMLVKGGKPRLLAAIKHIPHYSDDGGQNWISASGVNSKDGAAIRYPMVLDDSTSSVLFLNRLGWWEDIHLYYSDDQGENFNSILKLFTSDWSNVAMCKVQGTNEVYLIEQLAGSVSRLYKFDMEKRKMEIMNNHVLHAFGENGRANLQAVMQDSLINFFSYNGDDRLMRSQDFGASWEFIARLPVTPWRVGLFISSSDPNIMLIGAVECFRSIDQGKTWYKLNSWWEYYDQIETKLHADIMDFNEFIDPEGNPFILNSNHGGLNISYDGSNTYQNIGLENLNVGQYYSVASHPFDPNWIFAGSQDQGLQRSFAENQEIANFDQVISGDFGHNTFTGDFQHLWTVYPGGWVTFYLDPFSSGYIDSWELESEHESVWIPPIVPSSNESEDVVYMAGGNIHGGTGSHLIRLEFAGGQINGSQFDFNFRQSNDELSAIALAPFNDQVIYTGTTGGRFYKSMDGGNTFVESDIRVPGSHYLYGASILASKLDSNVVYYGGSGYSNPPVLKSDDGGNNFYPLSDGLPPTLVYDLAETSDGELLFAGTESGAYVFLQSESAWFDLSQTIAPNQNYWSVEYLELTQTARFGTYGRGIWDFKVEELASHTNESEMTLENVNVYPTILQNQSITIDVQSSFGDVYLVSLLNVSGQVIFERRFSNLSQTVVNLPGMSDGMYIIRIRQAQKLFTQKLIKL